MKKKFNLKLTIVLVSLFISLLIIILGNKNQYCLSFGFIFLGLTLFLFGNYSRSQIDKTIKSLDEDIDTIDKTDEESEYVLKELNKLRSKLLKKKKSTKLMFGLCAVLLILVGFIGFF